MYKDEAMQQQRIIAISMQNRSKSNHNMVLRQDKSKKFIVIQQCPLYQKLNWVAKLQTSKYVNKGDTNDHNLSYWTRTQEVPNQKFNKFNSKYQPEANVGVIKGLW